MKYLFTYPNQLSDGVEYPPFYSNFIQEKHTTNFEPQTIKDYFYTSSASPSAMGGVSNIRICVKSS